MTLSTQRHTRFASSRLLWGAIGALAIASAGCGSDDTTNPGPGGTPGTGADAGPGGTGNNPPPESNVWDMKLASRQLDYGSALRTASLRLRGKLPTLAEIKQLDSAADKKAAYETLIDQYIASPDFTAQVIDFWRNTFKMGPGTGNAPSSDTVPLFAAKLTVDNTDFTQLFTATTGTCPTLNNGTITAANCNNGVTTHAGVLTNPDMNRHFASNMAFRRARWVQETFDCTTFPAEFAATPTKIGTATYTGPVPFDKFPSATTGKVDFQDTKSVVCANCHTTLNIMAPLFAYFNDMGQYQQTMVAKVPVANTPNVTMADYLADPSLVGWRYNMKAATLPEFGTQMAKDPEVAKCIIARTWNWALGRGDIVDTLTIVPDNVIMQQVTAFQTGGYKLKDVIRSIYTSEDFTKFE